jgi:drug/metabolite transporter (DMT)-like permease
MLKGLSTYKKAIIALIIANIIWGAASPIFKYSLQNIPPFTLAFLRFNLASLLMLPFVYKDLIKYHSKTKEYWKSLLWYALTGVTINIIFFFLALQLTESINAPIIGSAAPIVTIALSMFYLGERPKPQKIIGAVVSMIGILIIIFEPLLKHGLDTSILGNLLLVLATLSAVVQTLIGRPLTQKYPPLLATFWAFAIGNLTFIPLLVTELPTMPAFDSRAFIGIAYGALLSSLAAYSLYAWGLSKIEASEVSLFAYIDPVIAIMVAYPLLGEKPDIYFVIGSLFVFVGIFVAERRIHYHPIYKLLKLT